MNYLKTRDIWVTSDTHFNHRSMLEWDNGRPEFSSVEEMNEVIIDNWNSVVKEGDYVYHLGDVVMTGKEEFKTLWPRLNGSKRLVVGNHDDIKFLSSGGFFKKVLCWRVFPEYECVLTHVPVLLNKFNHKYKYNLHGHTHRNYVTYDNGNKDTRYFNCCVEVNDYTPINLYRTMEKVQTGRFTYTNDYQHDDKEY